MNVKNVIFIVVGLIFFACSKEKENPQPVIDIEFPVQYQQINVGDSVRIKGKITDNQNIESVSVSLSDGNGVPVLSTISMLPNVPEYHLDIFYLVNDVHLSSGTYYFEISVFDGENRVRESVPVIVNGVSKSREGFFVFSNVSEQTFIYRLDTGLNVFFYKSLPGDYLGSALNIYDQQLISSGSISGKLTAIGTQGAGELWSLPLVNSLPFPSFTGVFLDNRTVYVGYYDGNIKGYGNNGVTNYSAKAHPDHYCESGLVHENFLLTEQPSKSIGVAEMVLYWMASGAERQQIALNEDVCGMYSLNTNEVVLFTNDGAANGKLSFYNISQNARSSPFNIGLGKIDASTEISTGVYLIARNGNLTIVNANTFSSLPYLSGVAASYLKYNELTNELILINGNVLTVYNYTLRTVKNSYTHHHPILDVQILYNK
ncbi:MAG: hypothetical protein J5I47_03915 [Vicingus serpentipes]|nr:hypothetical protein [Vicingus serpentipes]